MPDVVNQSAALEGGGGKGKAAKAEVPNRTGQTKTWKVAPDIFPRELSGSAKQIAQEVQPPFIKLHFRMRTHLCVPVTLHYDERPVGAVPDDRPLGL